MKVKPLSELLAEADRILGASIQKVASTKAEDEVSKLAAQLISAEALKNTSAQDSHEEINFDKIALDLNRADAILSLDMLNKICRFEKKASEAGFSNEQIEEATEKVAAGHLKQNLSKLVALDASTVNQGGPDKNTLKKKSVLTEAIGEKSRQVAATKNLGYGT